MLVTDWKLYKLCLSEISAVKVGPSKYDDAIDGSQPPRHHSFLMLKGTIIILLRKATKEKYQEYLKQVN